MWIKREVPIHDRFMDTGSNAINPLTANNYQTSNGSYFLGMPCFSCEVCATYSDFIARKEGRNYISGLGLTVANFAVLPDRTEDIKSVLMAASICLDLSYTLYELQIDLDTQFTKDVWRPPVRTK